MTDNNELICTCNCKYIKWSTKLLMYVCAGCGLPMPKEWYEDDDTIEDWQDHVCEYCHGTGGNLYDDGVTPCGHCGGAGSWL
jgi:hypothetical protein